MDGITVNRSKIRIVRLGSNYPEPGEYNQENDGPALQFHTFGDYSIDLFEHIDLSGNLPPRALYDMAPGHPRGITIWEDFSSNAILGDFFSVMDQPRLARRPAN